MVVRGICGDEYLGCGKCISGGSITTSVWLGGSDLAVEGEWRWSGGPEAGQMYWLGAAAGSAQGGFYTNWGGGEPNNSGGVEDGIQLLTGGTWNDINVASSLPYIVEWTGASVIAGLQNGPYSLAENSAGGSSVGFAHAGDPDEVDVLTIASQVGQGRRILQLTAQPERSTLRIRRQPTMGCNQLYS